MTRIKIVLSGFAALMSSVFLAVPTVGAATFSDVFDAALSGDMTKAFTVLGSLDSTKWTPKESTMAACLRQTFASPPVEEALPPSSKRILTAYRHYWQTAMLGRATQSDAQAELLKTLNTILPPDSASQNLDTASDRVKSTIAKEGLFALTGVTQPYYELMLWKTQKPTTYNVKLTDRSINVNVVFLDDFVSLGWAGYATCGRAHSGGWATQDSLYALRSAYDLASENFRVSYLAHEGRHFADYKLFPKLEQPELEYRAKLTEIAVSDSTTYDLVISFSSMNGRDRSVPHHFANYWVARDLAREVLHSDDVVTGPSRWSSVQAKRIRTAAARLLEKNSELIKKQGAAKTERFLEAPAG